MNFVFLSAVSVVGEEVVVVDVMDLTGHLVVLVEGGEKLALSAGLTGHCDLDSVEGEEGVVG